ncbi:hypothetical protein [Brevundimonas sp.]
MKTKLFVAASAVAILFASGASAQDMTFTVTNTSESTMTELWVGESSNEDWEHELLQGEEIAPGDSAEISIEDDLEDCTYDIHAEYDDGDSETVMDVDVCELNDLDVEDEDDGEEDEEEEEEE